MLPEPRDWDQLAGKYIWPDRVIYQLKEEGGVEAIYVYNRGNNRALPTEKVMLIHLFESLGLKVMISSNGILLTLDEFNNGVGYMTGLTSNSKQYILNQRYEVRRLQQHLSALDPSHPSYAKLAETLAVKRKMLETIPQAINQVDPPEDDKKAEQEKRLKEMAERGRKIQEEDRIQQQLEDLEKEANAKPEGS